MRIFYVWLAVISLISVVATVKDKLSAVLKKGRRVKENTLLILGGLGGASAMFLTMKLIRHKTLHKIFMFGLPVMIVFHVLMYIAVVYLLENYL